jgi:hypothetical protein
LWLLSLRQLHVPSFGIMKMLVHATMITNGWSEFLLSVAISILFGRISREPTFAIDSLNFPTLVAVRDGQVFFELFEFNTGSSYMRRADSATPAQQCFR